MARNSGQYLKRALFTRLNGSLRHDHIPGISENPLVIIERPLPFTPEPYIYISDPTSLEIDVTKDGSSSDHSIMVEVLVKRQHNLTGEETLDAIVDEISRVIDVNTSDYLDLSANNFSVYVQTITNTDKFVFEERGATYYKAIVTIKFEIVFTGGIVTFRPVQAPIYNFNGFLFSPRSNRIELHDSGTITGVTTYNSPNNGFTFESAAYSLAAGSDGDITGNIVTVDSDDANIDIISMLTYSMTGQDDEVLTATTEFDRVVSTRYGAVSTITNNPPVFTDDSAAIYGLRNLSEWEQGERRVVFGRNNGRGTYTFNANQGEYVYFIFDANQPNINIINIAAGIEEDITANFSVATVGAYKVYIQRRALSFTSSYTMRLE